MGKTNSFISVTPAVWQVGTTIQGCIFRPLYNQTQNPLYCHYTSVQQSLFYTETALLPRQRTLSTKSLFINTEHHKKTKAAQLCDGKQAFHNSERSGEWQ